MTKNHFGKKGNKIMKIFAQGDLLFVKVNIDGNNVKFDGTTEITISSEIERKQDGRLIVGHSETGHHHYIQASPNIAMLFGTNDPMTSVLRIKQETLLRHDRPSHPHAEIPMPIGDYVIRRQQEQRPEGWRKVVD